MKVDKLQQQIAKFVANQPQEVREEVQNRIQKTVEIWNTDPEDPFFLVLVQGLIIQVFYELVPNRLNRSFDIKLDLLKDSLEDYRKSFLECQHQSLERISNTVLKISTAKLDNAIANILEDNNISHKKSKLSPRTIASIVTAGGMLVTLTIGITGGLLFNRTSTAQKWIERQNAEDREKLEWVKSEEGKFARNLLEWNNDLLDRSCQRKVKDLGISFNIGSLKLTNGFCVVFVVPESQAR